ncbi:MAG: membrane protein insertase YidC [Bacteroidetes bacterium]|nr:membrane protein insertase YidC [Bacteroidota bacterium]
MDRNTLTGLLLIGAILIGYSLWMQPSQEEIEAHERANDSIENVQAERAEREAETVAISPREDTVEQVTSTLDSTAQALQDSLDRIRHKQRFGSFAAAAQGQETVHVIENDLVRLNISNKGAAPVRGELKEYVTYDSMPLLLFDESTSKFNFLFWADQNTELASSELYWTPVEEQMTSSKAVYRIYGQTEQQYLEVSYGLPEDGSYLVDANIEVVGMDNLLRASEDMFELSWELQAPFHEKSREQEQMKTTMYYKYMEDAADYVSEGSYEKEDLEATIQWVAFKQQFFSAALISELGFSKEGSSVETIELDDEEYTKGMAATMGMEFGNDRNPSFPFQIYLGPNHYQTLKNLEIGLEDQIDLGWAIFGWVNRFLVIPTFNILDNNTGLGYGIIILILTIFIKLILFPLTWKNYVSSARMKALKPEVDELNKKYENKDAMQKQQAVMGLYRQAGVNPMAGCVPMLLQLPILNAMFRFFPASIELRQESFLWAEDLSSYDSIYSLPWEIPFYGDHISLFTLLMAISTFFYSKYNMDMSGGANAQMPQMKMMIYFMPFMLLFFFNSYSSGLSYYYFMANVITMIQQFVIKRYFINDDAIRAKIQANKTKTKTKSKFQKRLEKMAKNRGYQPPKK